MPEPAAPKPSLLPPSSVGPDDWPVQAADALERLVTTVKRKTTKPALTVARFLVYGTLAGILGLAALVLFSAGLVRLLDVYLPGNVWKAHLITGGLFTLAGLGIWTKRRASPVE